MINLRQRETGNMDDYKNHEAEMAIIENNTTKEFMESEITIKEEWDESNKSEETIVFSDE